MERDTIVAVSTPPGEGALAIIRISGQGAVEIARSLFRTGSAGIVETFESHRVYYGFILDLKDGKKIDEVLLTVLLAPRSYTREDTIEISAHGGMQPVREILRQTLSAGARLAEPGEFTKRAFLNGRLDLAQAEAVMSVIRSRTEAGLKSAVSQLRGFLSRNIEELRREIIGLLALMEAEIDFPEDVELSAVYDESLKKIQGLIRKLDDLIASADKGRILQEGASLAIVGKPNVGKSSLLNRLLREARAIVTEIPGTTRDVLEAMVNIGGVPVRAFDTAGIRATTDRVERIGVERAREVILQADILLLVLDGSQPLTEEDSVLAAECAQKRSILVINKRDLPQAINKEALTEMAPGSSLLHISSLTGEGMPALEAEIASMLLGGEIVLEHITVANIRQVEALVRATEALRTGREAILCGQPAEITAVDLHDAADALGEITGETTTDDVVDRIFSDFCVGK